MSQRRAPSRGSMSEESTSAERSATGQRDQTLKEEPPVRVGLAAFGAVSRVVHAPLIEATPGMELAAVATSRPDEVGAQLPGVRLHPDTEALIADPDVDLVVVTTPNQQHVPVARAALAAGQHVVVEKPVALDAEEARVLARAAQEAAAQGLVSAVFHNRRWDGDFRTVAAALADGTLGRVVEVESRIDRFRPQVRERWREAPGPGGGLWADLGPHLVDQALLLCGRPSWVWADLGVVRDDAVTDDDVHVVLGYERLRVVLGASSLAAVPGPRFLVHGTAGSLVLEGFDVQESQLAAGLRPGDPGWGVDDRPATLATADGEQCLAREPGAWPAFYAGVRDAIFTGTPAPVTVGEAVVVMEILDAARASHATGARVPLTEID